MNEHREMQGSELLKVVIGPKCNGWKSKSGGTEGLRAREAPQPQSERTNRKGARDEANLTPLAAEGLKY